ncbi:MAG: hypothetical protein AB7E05_11310 [Sphingobium sp.]
MATLISELVRVLSQAASTELRARADGTPLSRAEMLAVATLNELSAVYLTESTPPSLPAGEIDWAALEAIAQFDADLIDMARRKRKRAA